MIVLLMGVTGAGKTTVGRMLAERLGCVFLEADDFHSAANKKKMHQGIPLTDTDRFPWLDAIRAEVLKQVAAGNSVVVGCSALKQVYRERLTHGLETKLVYLKGTPQFIAERLRSRSGHFAGESILADQFAVLEEPPDAFVVDVADTPETIVQKIVGHINATPRQLDSDGMGKHLLHRIGWRLLPFLFLLYVVAYLDRINVGFAALQMKDQLGFSDTAYGAGAGFVFFVGYFLFQVPSNLVLERIGARVWIGTLMVSWGIISASMSTVHSVTSFYILRFLLGATEAGFFPGVIFYLRGWFPPAVPAGILAMFMTAGPISGVIGGPISGALLDWDRRGGLAGWQWMFLMEGIPAILFGILAWFYLANGPENARWLTSQEKAWLRARRAIAKNQGTIVESSTAPPWWTSADLWRLVLVDFVINICTYGVTLWLPSALKSVSGLPNFLVGVTSAIPNLLAAAIMVLVGLHSDRTRERRWHIALSAFAGAAALFAAGSSTGVIVSVVAFGIALAASSSMAGTFWSMTSATLSEATAARGIALINAVGNLGGGFGPYWIGYLRDVTHSFRAGLWSVAIGMAIAGLTILAVRQGASRTAPSSPHHA